MDIVLPDSINESRVYFTELDRVTYSQVAWTKEDIEEIIRNLERKIKLLALTKGHVVIAASHLLESELAHEILLNHPRLFSEGVIVPALRSEFTGFESYLESKLASEKQAALYTGESVREMAHMLDSNVSLAVKWDVNQTAGWFRERLIADMSDERSLLRLCLRERGSVIPPTMVSHISEVPRLGRPDVYSAAKATGDKNLWHIVSQYADFLYYLSGARAVSSEGVLPQENLMDYSLSDLAGGRTHLPEIHVFFKIFIDIVKTGVNTHFPLDVLDVLQIEDVLDLHALAVEKRFVEKYNLIQRKTKDGLAIHDPERLVLLMDELEQFEHQLHGEYGKAIEREMPRYAKNIKKSRVAKVLNSTARLVIPAWGTVTDMKDMVISGIEYAGMDNIVQKTHQRIERLIKVFERFVDGTSLEEKPVLLDFVNGIKERYIRRISG